MRKLFSMKCPKCGHTYKYEGEECGWQNCPMPNCYKGKFREFVEYEEMYRKNK